MTLFIYTDGARKGGDGGWAFVAVSSRREVHRASGKVEGTTSSAMELRAILEALAWAHTKHPIDNVIIVTDSQVSIHVLTRPSKRNATGPHPKNHDLINQARSLLTERHRLEWVKGHAGNYWNEFVDTLAGQAVRDVPAAAVFRPRKPPLRFTPPPGPEAPEKASNPP